MTSKRNKSNTPQTGSRYCSTLTLLLWLISFIIAVSFYSHYVVYTSDKQNKQNKEIIQSSLYSLQASIKKSQLRSPSLQGNNVSLSSIGSGNIRKKVNIDTTTTTNNKDNKNNGSSSMSHIHPVTYASHRYIPALIPLAIIVD